MTRDEMGEADRTAAAVVRTLQVANDVSVEELAAEVNLSRAAFYERLAGRTAFLWREIVALARFFEVDVTHFETNPRTRVTSVSESAWIRKWAGQRHLELVAA